MPGGANIIWHLDGIANHNDRQIVLKNIRSGMSGDDIFIVTVSLDSHINKSQLSYNKHSKRQIWPLKFIGIDVESYQYSVQYDSDDRAKTKVLTLDKDYPLKFKIFGKEKIFH